MSNVNTAGTIAKELGVSRDAVQRLIVKLGVPEAGRAGNVRLFDAAGRDRIRREIEARRQGK